MLNQKYQEAMRNNHLFMDFDEQNFETIMKGTSVSDLNAGVALFTQQQPAKEFFLLLEGQIQISLLSSEGSEKVVDIIKAGNTFAEVIIFNGMQGYPVNATSLGDSKVLHINAEDYTQVLSGSPKACLKVMGRLSVRLHWLMNEMERLSLRNATYRLISFLLEDVPQGSTNKVEIKLGAPKRVIASRISITPETFSRTLKSLSKDNLIEVHDERIVINNPSKLRALLSI